MSAQEHLERIRGLEARASDGPWEYDPDSDIGPIWAGEPGNQQQVGDVVLDADGEFIAAMRNDVPWLLDLVRRQDAAVREVHHPEHWQDDTRRKGVRHLVRGIGPNALCSHCRKSYPCVTIQALDAAAEA